MAVKSAAGFVYTGWSKGRGVAKAAKHRSISAVGVPISAVGGGPYENCFTLSANSGMGV